MDGWWIDLLDADPVPWLLASDEPAARLATLTRALGSAKGGTGIPVPPQTGR